MNEGALYTPELSEDMQAALAFAAAKNGHTGRCTSSIGNGPETFRRLVKIFHTKTFNHSLGVI